MRRVENPVRLAQRHEFLQNTAMIIMMKNLDSFLQARL
jgi:hypothetical protein